MIFPLLFSGAMASITKRPESRYFICCYTAADGRQLKRSTKKVNRSDALRVCLEFEDAEKKAKAGLFTEAQARRVLAEIVERTTGEKMQNVTTREFLERWLDTKALTKADGTAKRYRHTVKAFLDQLGARANISISAIRPADIEQFRDAQTADGKSPATANMAMKTLRIPFNLARRQGLILTNPAEAVELLPAESASRDTFSPEQVKKLLTATTGDPEWRGMVLIGRYCGLRLGDIVSLTTGNLETEGQNFTLVVTPQKRRRGEKGEPLRVPVPAPVATWIRQCGFDGPGAGGPLFPTLSKVTPGGCNGLSSRFQKLMARAEVEQVILDRGVHGKGRRFHKLTFHSLRHTFISRLANAGVSRELRMKLSDHTSDVHTRYTHLELTALRAAIESSGID